MTMFAETFCHAADMSSEPAITPQEFAQTVIDAFDAAELYDDLAIRGADGPSSTTMTKYRKVALGVETMTEPRSDTYKAIDTAAQWEPGSARRLWRKGETPRRVLPGVSPENSATLREAILGADLEPATREALLRILDSA